VVIEESVATLPGLDGRKMSKSYDNTIPLFEGGRMRLKDTIARIVTDSKLPGAPKDPESSPLVTIYRAFASAEETAQFEHALREGLGWGEAKQRLFERLERDIAPMRERYEALMARPQEIEELLQIGAKKARAIAAPLLGRLRDAVGLRAFKALPVAKKVDAKAMRAAQPSFKQYRESDGKFYFKLLAADGRLLLQSAGFDSPRDAGDSIAALKREGRLLPDERHALGEGVAVAEVDAALAALAEAS
jgi:tryptophanyl-tRNA synthetase